MVIERTKQYYYTHMWLEWEYETPLKVANCVIRALKRLNFGIDQGTVKNPFETASIVMNDGRTLIQTIYEDGYINYNDGYIIVDYDGQCLYVDYTGFAINEFNLLAEQRNSYYDQIGLQTIKDEFVIEFNEKYSNIIFDGKKFGNIKLFVDVFDEYKLKVKDNTDNILYEYKPDYLKLPTSTIIKGFLQSVNIFINNN